jgi:hypothetical protein
MTIPTLNKFEGFPLPADPQLPLIDFYIGEDIILTVPCFLNSLPVTPEHWNVTAILNSSVNNAECPIWKGVLHNGLLYSAENPGTFKLIIPASLTNTLSPGTYWIDFFAKEPIGAGKEIDRTILLQRLPVGLNYSAFSKKTKDSSPPEVDITMV